MAIIDNDARDIDWILTSRMLATLVPSSFDLALFLPSDPLRRHQVLRT